ncbi:hypothetical protein LG3211_0426 [Lysobacter gummosus]|nr:hypothetical protein LG3211_0426 [Lysobacter gummosus]
MKKWAGACESVGGDEAAAPGDWLALAGILVKQKRIPPGPPARRHSLRAFSAARICGSQARPFTLFQRGEPVEEGLRGVGSNWLRR